ncbi:hypothetical protein ACFL6I_28640, partial [candidate division KSB1 bacterium]
LLFGLFQIIERRNECKLLVRYEPRTDTVGDYYYYLRYDFNNHPSRTGYNKDTGAYKYYDTSTYVKMLIKFDTLKEALSTCRHDKARVK